jgi:hypothetical protein
VQTFLQLLQLLPLELTQFVLVQQKVVLAKTVGVVVELEDHPNYVISVGSGSVGEVRAEPSQGGVHSSLGLVEMVCVVHRVVESSGLKVVIVVYFL